MLPSLIDPRVLRLLGRRAEARLARAGELVADARRDASAASHELECARRVLASLDLEIVRTREALRRRIAQGASHTDFLNRNDFAGHEHAYTHLMARRSNAGSAVDTANERFEVARAALAAALDTQRKCWRQREKYRLAERLSARAGIEDPVDLSSLTVSSTPPMRVQG
ncbi:hypothetical protein GWC77_00605 [Paraburkholderia sp. NMBU_R16]|uniref:hypothetical protein n=1 Tax=Paraburkholderia sp. NMBU_R16 TaxID=2698676 RepID=UPI0015652FC8|nr:hypothetical protein [Paraburkholderia sp. NMBU_R16]NRO94442.1 hypothetical protein [Paraburkholderia sp. NMBU_R16]